MTYYIKNETSAYPYSAVTLIEVTYPDGTKRIGTGAVVGENDVLTSSSLIYDLNHGGLGSISVTPGFDASYSVSVSDFSPDLIWYYPVDQNGLSEVTSSEGYDLALLGFSNSIGNETGWFGLDFSGHSASYNLSGFPIAFEDENGLRMTNEHGSATFSSDNQTYYFEDIDSYDGLSGAPLWYQGEDGGYIVGIGSTNEHATALYSQTDLLTALTSNDYLLTGESAKPTDTNDSKDGDTDNNSKDGDTDSSSKGGNSDNGTNTSSKDDNFSSKNAGSLGSSSKKGPGLGEGNQFAGTDGIDVLSYSLFNHDEVTLQATENENGSPDITVNFNNNGVSGVDTLTSYERLIFKDTSIAFDLGVEQSAGSALSLLFAAFDSMPDEDTFGQWIAKSDQLLDQGKDTTDLAQAMIDFYAPTGVDNEVLVDLLYTNIFDLSPNAGEIEQFSSLIDIGLFTQASLFALAAETELNTDQYAELIGQKGLNYTEQDSKAG